MSIPHLANDQVGSIVCRFIAGAFTLLADIWQLWQDLTISLLLFWADGH
jgi:hypothetical protein